ncbi:MAG: hypothetical protein GEU94_19400 [Micromonosporaceae bacterium]|nr:hypothetical protein [Micromonosporaceae bacterium]
MNNFAKLVRSLVLEDFKRFDKRLRDLEAAQDRDGFGEFVGSCFYLAVTRRFGAEHSIVDIIRFVANTRMVYDLTGSDIDPSATERLIRTGLGEDNLLANVDPRVIPTIQIILIHKLLSEEELYDDEVDAFLREAEDLAKRWRAQSALELLQEMGYTVKPPLKDASRPDRLAS